MKGHRFSGLLGMVAPIFMLIFVFVAISLKPDFSWTDDSLSSIAGMEGDLAFWTATGPPAIVFNMTLIDTGILLMLFSLGLRRSKDFGSGLGKNGATLFVFTGFMLLLIGVFPLTFGTLHNVISITLFIVNPVAILIMGAHLLLRQEKGLGRLSVLLGAVGLLPFILPRPWPGIAITEMMAILPTSVFTILFAYRLYTQDDRKEKDDEDLAEDDSEE